MSSFRKFGLTVLVILCVSHNLKQIGSIPTTNGKNQNTSDSYYDDLYGDYYDDDDDSSSDNDTTLITPNVSSEKTYLSKTTKTLTTATAMLTKEFERELENNMKNNYDDVEIELPKRNNYVSEPICPKSCLCTDDYKRIQCSNARLTHVPKGIPATAVHVNLSHNQITDIRMSDFINCSKVREINLNGNRITSIEKDAFSHNRRLQKLLLNNNRLTTIDPNTFSLAKDMEILDLSNNSIVLPREGSFLNQPDLLELFCRNCSWRELYDETFANLSGLNSLKLDGNNFNKKINTKAFEPMKNLIKLRLPELEQDNIQELCNVLKSIDNISLKRFDISCYELVLGTSFNESLIYPTLLTTPKTSQAENKLNSDQKKDKTPPAVHSSGEKHLTSPDHQHSLAVEKKATNMAQPLPNDSSSAASNLTLSQNEVASMADTNSTSASTSENGVLLAGTAGETSETEKTYQMEVSREVINYMLMSIMILAVIGIIIGFICRRDYGGIKTKCCRTRKSPPAEQNRPGEDIPLNKISLGREQV